MNKLCDKFGYFILILGFIAINYKYGEYLLYETTYLCMGDYKQVTVKEIERKDNKYLYTYNILIDSRVVEYRSPPTTKQLTLGEKVTTRTVPIFGVVLLGKFTFISYIIGVMLFLIGLILTFLSCSIILNLDNYITKKFKISK